MSGSNLKIFDWDFVCGSDFFSFAVTLYLSLKVNGFKSAFAVFAGKTVKRYAPVA